MYTFFLYVFYLLILFLFLLLLLLLLLVFVLCKLPKKDFVNFYFFNWFADEFAIVEHCLVLS